MGLFKQALDTHIFFEDAAQGENWFAWLADYLDCSPYMARRVWKDLSLGEVRATVREDRPIWTEHPKGKRMLTLPLIRGHLLDQGSEVIDILAFDPARPDQVFFKSHRDQVLGSMALYRSNTSALWPVTLYENIQEWLTAWAAFWWGQLNQAASRPDGTATHLSRARGVYSDEFPGVCFLDPQVSVLKNLGGVMDINVAGAKFAQQVADQLRREISSKQYPRILLTKEG